MHPGVAPLPGWGAPWALFEDQLDLSLAGERDRHRKCLLLACCLARDQDAAGHRCPARSLLSVLPASLGNI